MNSPDRQKAANKAAGSKYGRLFEVLLARRDPVWRTTFREIEELLGFRLPPSARCHNAWWANEGLGGRHTQALAWTAAGWKTSDVDMAAETLMFERLKPARTPRVKRAKIDLDKDWPVHDAGGWPEGLSLRREDIYEDWSSKTFAQDVRLRQAAAASKYSRLFIHLVDRNDYKWRTTFEEVEEVLEFDLPESARNHRPWWANDESHTHALAWIAAGWKTAEVDMAAKTLTFERPKPARIPRAKRTKIDLDKEFPVHHAKLLRKDATFSREEIYEDRI